MRWLHNRATCDTRFGMDIMGIYGHLRTFPNFRRRKPMHAAHKGAIYSAQDPVGFYRDLLGFMGVLIGPARVGLAGSATRALRQSIFIRQGFTPVYTDDIQARKKPRVRALIGAARGQTAYSQCSRASSWESYSLFDFEFKSLRGSLTYHYQFGNFIGACYQEKNAQGVLGEPPRFRAAAKGLVPRGIAGELEKLDRDQGSLPKRQHFEK